MSRTTEDNQNNGSRQIQRLFLISQKILSGNHGSRLLTKSRFARLKTNHFTFYGEKKAIHENTFYNPQCSLKAGAIDLKVSFFSMEITKQNLKMVNMVVSDQTQHTDQHLRCLLSVKLLDLEETTVRIIMQTDAEVNERVFSRFLNFLNC